MLDTDNILEIAALDQQLRQFWLNKQTAIKGLEEQKPDLLPHDSARPHDQLGDMEGAGGDDVHLAQQPGVHLSVYLDNTDVFCD